MILANEEGAIFRCEFKDRGALIDGSISENIIQSMNKEWLDRLKGIRVIHCHDWFLSGFIEHLPHCKLISYFHSCKSSEYGGKLTGQRRLIHQLQKQLAKKSDLNIVYSCNMKNSLTKDLKADNVVQSRPPVYYEQKTFGQRRSTGLAIYYFGRLAQEKNVLLLLNALKILMQYHEITLKIRGDGPERKKICNFLIENNMSNVELLGWSNDIALINYELASSDLFVLPSVYEPLGLAAFEALSQGCLSIVSSCCGFLDYYDDTDAFSFESNSISSLVRKIELIIHNRKQYIRRQALGFKQFLSRQSNANFYEIVERL